MPSLTMPQVCQFWLPPLHGAKVGVWDSTVSHAVLPSLMLLGNGIMLGESQVE